MEGELPEKVEKLIESESEDEPKTGGCQDASLSDYLDCPEPIIKWEKIKLEILHSASLNANEVFKRVNEEEARKQKWRKYFIRFFCKLLVLSLVFIAIIIIGVARGDFSLSNEVILGMFVYVVANIFSLLYFMVKYVSDTKHLDMFKIVTGKMLDFLLQDGNSSTNKERVQK